MGGGKGKGQLSPRPVGTLVFRERMGKALALQSGRALPMDRSLGPLHPIVHSVSGGGGRP